MALMIVKASIDRAATGRMIQSSCLCISAEYLIFASRGLLTGYSYWLDELYSVSASLDSWKNLYWAWILQDDVHPPLYHSILKLWMSLFGSSEIATRLLSFALAAVTLATFSYNAIRTQRWCRVLALLLISASPAFAFYSQETRSYSLVLALSSLVTLAALELRSTERNAATSPAHGLNLLFYSGSLLLSLTHYFGWIYVFILALISAWERRLPGVRSKAILLILLMTLWPLFHIVFGQLGGTTGGHFWIKVNPPILGAIISYLNGCLPMMVAEGARNLFIATWSLLLGLALVAAGSWANIRCFLNPLLTAENPLADESRFTLMVITAVVAVMAIIDLHTPMSTPRNYIVLLPPTMLLVSNGVVMLADSAGPKAPAAAVAAFLTLTMITLLSMQSWTSLSGKISPQQNWQQLAAYVKDSGVCRQGCFVMGSHKGVYQYYFSPDSGSFTDLSLKPGITTQPVSNASLDEQLAAVIHRADARILGFHLASASVPTLLKENRSRTCLQPTQDIADNAFIIIPAFDLTGREGLFGLVRCHGS